MRGEAPDADATLARWTRGPDATRARILRRAKDSPYLVSYLRSVLSARSWGWLQRTALTGPEMNGAAIQIHGEQV
jgi:hypothetical protein